jgi:streptogramin lyase
VVAQFAGHLADRPHFFVDRTGNAWITEQGRHIYRVTPQGKAECVYTIDDNQLREQGRPKNDRSRFNPVSAAADSRGRVWFWSDCLGICAPLAALQGVLIFTGEGFEHHPQITGVPDKRLSIVAPDDAEHMWLAVANDQLYRVDINTLTATPGPAPDPQSFRYVQNIFHGNQETYLVSGSNWQPVPERNANCRLGALWRLKDGEWKRLVNGLDMRSELSQYRFRPWLTTEGGLWLGAFGVGPWFIPTGEGEPALVDWHYGFPLDGSEGLFQLADGRLLIVAANQGSIAVKPADLLAAFQSPPEVRTLNPLRPFIQDVRGHILGLLATGDHALSDWDGQTWKDHPLPGGFDPAYFQAFAEDSWQRIWLLPDARGQSVAIFDPVHETFEIYPGYSEALQAQLSHRENFHLQGDPFRVPSFTPDGRICYRDERSRIRYFDGQKWLLLTRLDIDGSNVFAFDGPAFFDRAGNLAINIQGKTWEFSETAGWRTTSFEPGLGTDRERQVVHSPAAPPGCEFSNPESIVQDRLGTYWLTHHGQLYRAIAGLCLAQFSAQEHHPFMDSRTLKNAFVDLRGNAFLESYFYGNGQIGEYVIVDARQPLPQTALGASVDASGTVTLRFSARGKGAAGFTWRIDGGPWSAATKGPETRLDDLPNGKHRIEAAAIDGGLQIDPTPAEAAIDVHVDAAKQIGELIQKLTDADYSVREKAVASLVLHAAPALPLLQATREKAGPDQRWWIDAAIQQIEENLAKNGQP